jgi:hypothetical protein
MHGFTWSKSVNTYQLVTGDKSNFGDKRLKYNKGFHTHSMLSNFLTCECNTRGNPDFIYEYMTDTKCRGIKLYYASLDSVFVFEEPKKNNVHSFQKESRKMTDEERKAYQQLLFTRKKV